MCAQSAAPRWAAGGLAEPQIVITVNVEAQTDATGPLSGRANAAICPSVFDSMFGQLPAVIEQQCAAIPAYGDAGAGAAVGLGSPEAPAPSARAAAHRWEFRSDVQTARRSCRGGGRHCCAPTRKRPANRHRQVRAARLPGGGIVAAEGISTSAMSWLHQALLRIGDLHAVRTVTGA